ncbi:short chain dehydrogenase/reductase [Chloropicon primus]|uniref:Short chain dehydrogenase/reductase n=1 Tax=Chloropicon primus TaxID=1764295 RepID=A0A5B8MH97_9CHLO|nr:short chain dehydrogenase/reductase [Chloropicon primus]UPQ97939.1 short chain dehydrogenase/reductase [Chloropicon primus]|mmetsp:Transcript_8903/g.25409  ORF Transcript_8903/g.25409 Transcript_8903/m.25409 type:complete len:370 (-) Transcript_8903:831-1940(-)|eukprot:QDZ18732.1 short chain dehydrogenase/reductase [Chloropicon primus]
MGTKRWGLSPVWHPMNMIRMVVWFIYLLLSHAQVFRKPGERDDWKQKLPKVSLGGSTVMITGPSSGLGFAFALEFAKVKGCHVVLLCRTAASAEATESRIRRAIPDASLESFALDLRDPQGVLSFARRFAQGLGARGKRRPPLKLLVNNAGVYSRQATYTEAHGLERTFAANIFGHYLLTDELLPLLSEARGTVAFTSSFSHRAVTESEFQAFLKGVVHRGEDKGHSKGGSRKAKMYPAQAYACTKLAVLLLPEYLRSASRYEGVKYLWVDPGAVNTRITRSWPCLLVGSYQIVLKALGLFADPARIAASLAGAIQGGLDGVYLFGERGDRLNASMLSKDLGLALQLVHRCEDVRRSLNLCEQRELCQR